jgi:hypothetical protein
MRRFAVAAGAVVVLALGGVVAQAAIPNADGNIYACYDNKSGAVRVQDDPAVPCAKGSTALHWSASQPHVPVTTTYVVRASGLVQPSGQPDSIIDVRANCNAGDVATGGGVFNVWDGLVAQDEPGPTDNFGVPLSPPTQWHGVFNNHASFGGVAIVHAVCQHTE